MKKYLTKRNIFLLLAIATLIGAIFSAFLTVYDEKARLLFHLVSNSFIRAFANPHAMISGDYVVVYRAVLFAVFLLGAVVFAVLFLVEIRKGKPTYKQRIAELEKQIAELKQNQKD